MYLIASTEQAGTLVSHSLSDLSFGCVTSWGDFCSVPHTIDANSVTWPHGHEIRWNSLSTDMSWQSWPSCLPITFTIQILCVKLEWFILCVAVAQRVFFVCVEIFIVLKCCHFYISYLCAKFIHTTLNDTNIASASKVCTVFSLMLWMVGGYILPVGSMLVVQFTVSLWLCLWCCCWWWLKWETLIDGQIHVFIM